MKDKDMRRRARLPYGYEICDGAAIPNPKEAAVLKRYFQLFLEGASMARAAKEAGFDCSSTAMAAYFFKKELTGTDYYPAIISKEYQEELIREYQRRKGKRSPRLSSRSPKGVPVFMDFKLDPLPDILPENPEDYVDVIYQTIRPKA